MSEAVACSLLVFIVTSQIFLIPGINGRHHNQSFCNRNSFMKLDTSIVRDSVEANISGGHWGNANEVK